MTRAVIVTAEGRPLPLCPCPACVRASYAFPFDPPQLPLPVAIYPSTRRGQGTLRPIEGGLQAGGMAAEPTLARPTERTLP